MKKMSLEVRLLTFISTISLVTIATFTTIQLKHQMDNTTKQTVFQSKINAITIKNNFESFAKQTSLKETLIKGMQAIIDSLTKSNLARNLEIADETGLIVASSEASRVLTHLESTERKAYQAMTQTVKHHQEKWLFSQIDHKEKLLKLYIPIIHSEGIYVIRALYTIGNLQDAISKTYKTIILMIAVIAAINAFLAFMLIRMTIQPILKLNDATKAVASGNLEQKVTIRTGDEIEELSHTFNEMTLQIRKMKQRAENANPLTKLPGNIVIHEEVDERIKNNKKFMVIYSDLDNFKAFNDKYGIHAGDKAIMISADIFRESIEKLGDEDDFIGHEGGDDFILLTTPEKSEKIANFITTEFDKRIRSLYSEEDLAQGKIVSKDRKGNVAEFPIATISLAGITNAHRKIETYAEVTNIAAGVKKKAKATAGSCFVVDQRKDEERE